MQGGEVTFSEENINEVTCSDPPATETTCVSHHEHAHCGHKEQRVNFTDYL